MLNKLLPWRICHYAPVSFKGEQDRIILLLFMSYSLDGGTLSAIREHLFSSKTPDEQERLFKILLEMDKYRSK